MHKKQMLFL